MRIQRIVISRGEHPSLYFRGGAESEGRITLKSGERLSFDTYFNSFTHTKYKDYTTLEGITFCGVIEGKARISLCSYDGIRECRLADCQAENVFSLSVELSALLQGSFLYPVVEAIEDTVFVAGEYCADASPTQISCAIAICTYRREEYLKSNLKILQEASIPAIDRVLVIDNGGTVNADELPSIAALFQNPNFGGSAGFTRGIIEAKKRDFSHVILMDDDIVIYPEALERMTAFLSILRPEFKNAHISAAMLPTSCLYLQHEKGARWNGRHIESMHTGLDVRERDALVQNLCDGPIEYGAWWCFCLPLTDTDEFGLPLPLFIKFDDVEYGMRCCKNTAPIITMSGLAVAHADFDAKYNMHLEYYTVRNQLIMLAAHGMQGTCGCISRLIKTAAKNLWFYRYAAMPIILRAFTDFLRGAEFLMSVNAEELNRKVIAMSPPAVALDSLPEWTPEMRTSYAPPKKDRLRFAVDVLTLGGHLIPRAWMRKKTLAIPLPSAKPGECFLYRRTVQYQMGSDFGYVLEKNSFKFFACLGAAVKMSVKILFTYRRAAKSYKDNFSKMTSLAFWERYLKL